MGLVVRYSCNAYHGTNDFVRDKIVKEESFEISDSENEWAGSGVYFFVDTDDNVACHNAFAWAKNKKKLSVYNIGIVGVKIVYNSNEILDLCNDDQIKLFNEYRKRYFQRAVDVAKSKGKCLTDRYTNATKFDCFIINTICTKLNYKVVRKSAYINVLEEKYCDNKLPNSFIPNCIIIAVRDQKIIKQIWSEKYEQKL